MGAPSPLGPPPGPTAEDELPQVLREAHRRNILQALQLVVLSNVYIWKLWWLALALSGLMLDLAGDSRRCTCVTRELPRGWLCRVGGPDSSPGSAQPWAGCGKDRAGVVSWGARELQGQVGL